MEEALKKMIEQQRDWMASQLSEQWKLMEEQVSRLANQLQDLQTQGSGNYQESGNSSNHNGGRNLFHFNPKIEFPSFEGGNPREWIKKCRQYFSLCKVPEEQQVNLASIHFKGRAEIWFSNYGQGRNNICWDEFVMDLGARFKEDDHNDIVEEFNKLCQTGDLEEYVDKFEELKGLLLRKRPNMPQEYFLDSFIAGLKPQIKPFVKAFAPTSVTKAISYARLQEQTVEAWRTQDKSNKHSQLQSNMGRNNAPLLAKPESSTKSSTPTGYQGAFRPQGSYNTSSSANKPTFTQRNPKFILASREDYPIKGGLEDKEAIPQEVERVLAHSLNMKGEGEASKCHVKEARRMKNNSPYCNSSEQLHMHLVEMLKNKFGYDDAFNYKEEKDLRATLKRLNL
ncbi:unnamed protein product [Cuscuta campestris]|uniref:Ty3 transposon capsid-like protein domain-containing protein n=1 Tax=Cuscuta campestris TaxID=132261 RepID=A0A484LDN0_9ASTE|nr:unnamed protein product [Cuscuta campestris]